MNTENNKLYRSRDDRKIVGVCGGLAKYLNINIHLLRWAFVLTGQMTAPLYLLMWIYLEEEAGWRLAPMKRYPQRKWVVTKLDNLDMSRVIWGMIFEQRLAQPVPASERRSMI